MRYLALSLLVVALSVPSEANAQYRGNRGGGRGYGGGSWNGNWNNGNWNNSGWNRGWYGGRVYYGYPYMSFGLGTTNYAYTPGYTYSYPSDPRSSLYYDPDYVSDPTVATPLPSKNQARVVVRLLDPNDEVTIQGQAMPGTGLVRTFNSPELVPGTDYSYTISVRRPNASVKEETRTVNFKAGATIVVDFTQPASSEPGKMPMPAK